ncbi:unnamed protein product [Eruca vesicaria subsp. sativa]|uniref:Protein argonaute 5 n=1 Tax=Eruca vesicaria subsp. sativa TaxID=29727 RepID=A0ABC8ISR2_ERUVS|nr:unnamed protein product [Eruca vesicaria subsp. sativa]
MSSRGGHSGAGRGRRSDQKQEQSSGAVSWPALQSSSAARGGSVSGGRGRGGRGNTPAVSSSPSDVVSGVIGAVDVASSSSVREKPKVAASDAGSSLGQELAEKVKITPETTVPPASSKAVRFPVRPGFGQAGKKVTIRANHFLVQVADRDLYHYDVSITPEVVSKKVNREVMTTLVRTYGESHMAKKIPAYDGRKSLYTAGALPFETKEFVVDLNDKKPPASSKRDRKFKVALKLASSRPDLFQLQEFLRRKQRDAPYETIQVLDVVLRDQPSQKYVAVGRSFFDPSLGRRGELADGVEYWSGYFQSLRLTQMGLSLNIDVSARSFYEPILVTEFIGKYLNLRDFNRPLRDSDRVKVKKALKSLKVELGHFNFARSSKISGISSCPINELRFTLEDNTQKTVVQYFAEKYNFRVKYPYLPAIQSGSDSKPAYFPMELCRIAEGQRYTKKLNERQVTAMLKATCQRPEARENSIKGMVKNNKYNEIDLVRKEFGMSVTDQLASVEARVLPPPLLKYHESGREKMVNPRLGQWNMIDKKMINGARVASWTCVSFSTRIDRNLPQDFCKQLIGMCVDKGMQVNPQPAIPFISCQPQRIEEALCDIHKRAPGLQMLIVILPDVTGSYGKIKRICETELGIVSQCCQPNNVRKLNKQYMENVALKINVKAGGRNTVLDDAIRKRIPLISDRPTIIFGADVTHPQAGEDSSPSIAAVVASMDWPEITKYRGLVSAQTHREEIIEDLYKLVQDPQRGPVHSGMIREHLIAFRRATGQKPQRIIFYRDGVSEGQFSQVLLHEMTAIRKACASLEEGYLPRVTFVVVQKRHHTRLFPAQHQNRDTTDRSGNIQPGTVVDTKICHPTEFDFYLNSHAGIQGTSRPAHYHVLVDENGFTADGLQMLTNNLCYTFARCTRSVSIVPPAYYAHLAAFRARYYMESEISDGGSSRSRNTTASTSAVVARLPSIKDNVKDVMFYC